MLEEWNSGMLEYGSIETENSKLLTAIWYCQLFLFPSFQHSHIPIFQ